jgi:hypothetical protein
MASIINIEFLIDFEEGYTSGISVIETVGNPTSLGFWDWVALRSAGFEVTTGTPTVIAGETTAINFKAAFDLDYPTGYTTTVTDNNLQIESTTIGENWIGFKVTDSDGVIVENGGGYVVTFDNDDTTFDISTVSNILTRSPHYVTTPFYFETTTKSLIQVKIWSGHFTDDEPIDITRSIEKIRPTIDYEVFDTNISEIIDSSLDGKPILNTTATSVIQPLTTNDTKWVRYSATFTDPTQSITPITGFFSASEGYGYTLEGINPQLPRTYLTSCLRRRVDRQGVIMIPFVNDGYYDDIDVLTSPSSEYSQNHVLTVSEESEDYVQYMIVNTSDILVDNMVIVKLGISGGGADILYFDIEDGCRYTPKTILFRNKFGYFDTLTMLMKHETELSTRRTTFVNNYVSNGSYDTTTHQYKDINIMGRESIRCNSGVIKEAEAELYYELALSNSVFFLEEGSLIPVNIKTSNIPYKTRVNDGLIQYEVNFEYGFNKVNNI